MHAIAGICNDARNVVGMMPHPERACEPTLGSTRWSGACSNRWCSRWRGRTDARAHDRPSVLERHGLKPDEYDRIVAFLGREPNLTELGIFSVMWSEHCSYKSSRVHLRTLPTEGPQVLQGPGENAGAVDIGEGLAAVFKIESHNHPSFIEPYQGAATGVGGIIRDIFTMGARPDRADELAPVRRPRRARDQASARGRRRRHRRLRQQHRHSDGRRRDCLRALLRRQPLVNVFCLGIAKASDIIKGVASGRATPCITWAPRPAATAFTARRWPRRSSTTSLAEKRPAVQVGDPFMEKLLLEACLEVMQTDALVGIQDMGAAGLTCSTTEMGSRGGAGIEIDVVARAAARDRHDAVRDHALGDRRSACCSS